MEGGISSSITLYLLNTALAVQRGCKSLLTNQHMMCFTCFPSCWAALEVPSRVVGTTQPASESA